MRKLIPILLSVLVAGSAVAADHSQEEKAVLAAEDKICAAYERNDADGLAKLLDAKFTLTNSKGVVSTGTDEVAEVRGGKVKYEVFRNHDSTVSFYGNTAIVLGSTTIKGTSEGQAFTGEYKFTDTLVRDKDGWRIVAGHATRLPDAPAK